MLDTEDKWFSHKDLKVTKDIVSIHVDTRDFNLYVGKDEDEKVNIDLKILEIPKFCFTTVQVKAAINKLFKASGGEKDWRFLHFVNEEEKTILGGNWQYKYLRFYKLQPNKWVCTVRDNLPVEKETFDLLTFGDIMSSHEYSKKKGWIDEKSEFQESQIANLKNDTRKAEREAAHYEKVSKQAARLKSNRKPVVKDKKIHRNEPCPCGSGKKHKKCCLLKKQNL